MGAIPIDQSIEYENGKFSCAFTVTEQAVKDLNDKVEDELFERIAAMRGYVKERTYRYNERDMELAYLHGLEDARRGLMPDHRSVLS